MDGVDRMDQLRQLFSLSARHGFKKYYVKIALGLLDMAITNVWLDYKMVHPKECKKETARYNFYKSLAETMCTTNWVSYLTSNEGLRNHSVIHELVGGPNSPRRPTRDVPTVLDDDDASSACTCTPYTVNNLLRGRMSKRKGFSCQICAFEGRSNSRCRNVL